MKLNKSATIYIVRHGETVGNSQRLLLSPDKGVLSETGKQQVKLLGETLKSVRFNKVFTSQYPRTKETANIILSCNDHRLLRSKIKVDPRLREIDMDGMYGKPYAYLLEGLIKFLQSGADLDKFEIDGSEPMSQLKKRAMDFMTELFQEVFSLDEPLIILIVSHGTFIRSLMMGLNESKEFDRSGWDPSGQNIIRNSGVMKLKVTNSPNCKTHINFEKLHDTSHLPKEMLQTDALTKLITQTSEGKCLSGCFHV